MYTNLSRYYLHVLEVDDQITQRTMVHIQRIDQDTSSSMFLWSLRCSLSCTFFSYLCSVLWKLVLTFCLSFLLSNVGHCIVCAARYHGFSLSFNIFFSREVHFHIVKMYKDKEVNKNVKNILLSMCDVRVFLTFTSLNLVLL